MPTDQIKDVPTNEVGSQVQELVDYGGVTEIKCVPQENGLWTITAISQ